MDGLVAKYYKQKGIEALYTTTMPMYSKTKSTTIAGGINKPLLVKDLQHKFVAETVNGNVLYRHVTTVPEDSSAADILLTHPNFPTMLVVEVFKPLSQLNLEPLPVLVDGSKVIYTMRHKNVKTELEIKLEIPDIASTLTKLRTLATYSKTEYLRDVIYG